MEKRQLNHGKITVWQTEEGGMIVHHTNGLTIELTEAERNDLQDIMDEWEDQKDGVTALFDRVFEKGRTHEQVDTN